MKYDYAVIVGRFQPFHNIHFKVVQHGLSIADKVLIILGSATNAPDVKNPFTPKFREEMIRACFTDEMNKRVEFSSIRDYLYNDNHWVAEIQNLVQIHIENLDKQAKVALVGYFKDRDSYWLKLFPQWTFEEYYENTPESRLLNATDIRAMYFEDMTLPLLKELDKIKSATNIRAGEATWERLVPKQIATYLREFAKTETYDKLRKEYEYIKQYKKDTKFVGVPFSPTFVTTDTLVTAMGHVLVVQRGHQPGKGCLALPGGFLAEGLRLADNAVKELREETNIHLPAALLKGRIIGQEVFDHPNRSLRGRTITHAFHIDLNPKMEDGLPKVKGGDDADKAFWLPIADVRQREDEFFEDHIHIVRHFLGF